MKGAGIANASPRLKARIAGGLYLPSFLTADFSAAQSLASTP